MNNDNFDFHSVFVLRFSTCTYNSVKMSHIFEFFNCALFEYFQLNMEHTPENTLKQILGSVNQAEDHKWKKEMVFVIKHLCSCKCALNNSIQNALKFFFFFCFLSQEQLKCLYQAQTETLEAQVVSLK